MKRQRILSAVLSALLLIWLAQRLLIHDGLLRAGTPAPDFSVTATDGRRISLAGLRGKVVLVDFWATWCGPCVMSMPTLEAMQQRFGARGFTVVGISADLPDTADQVVPFAHRLGITYPVATSPDANVAIRRAYNESGLPSQYLIDRQGRIVWSQAGYSSDEATELPKKIDPLLESN